MKHINPSSVFNSQQYGFSQAVVSDSNVSFFQTSGQVAVDKEEKILGGLNVGEQTRHALNNLKTVVEAAGGRVADVMMVRLYIVKLEAADTTSIGIAFREVFGTENPPASSWIGVTALARPEFLIEIEAQGIIEAVSPPLPVNPQTLSESAYPNQDEI